MVDDEPSVRTVVSRFLTGERFKVVEAQDGLEALALLRADRPALVILDVDMPRLDGWKTLKLIHEIDRRLPVIMLTNSDTVPARIKGLNDGADDYIGKPCDLGELLARINAQLRHVQRQVAPSRLRFGPTVVDLDRKAAMRDGTSVNLTANEYQLLGLLAQHHGKPVTRDQMLRRVWNADRTVNSHMIDTCLWRLRRKLGDDGSSGRWIQNLHGIGYVLRCEFDTADGAPIPDRDIMSGI